MGWLGGCCRNTDWKFLGGESAVWWGYHVSSDVQAISGDTGSFHQVALRIQFIFFAS
jgi:hypothetical protein